MNPIRVVHIDSGSTWRGGQRQAFLLALGLRDRGHQQYLVGSPQSPLAERARAAGLAVAAVQMRADWDLRAARRIRSRLRTWRPDIVHAHDARAHAMAMLALLGQREIPLVVTRRVPFTPRSARIKYGNRVARFIAISEAVRKAMVEGGIDSGRIDVVHSGIEIPFTQPPPRDWRAELGWPAESVVCGVVGAMTAEKGTDMLESIGRAIPEEARKLVRFVLLGGEAAGLASIGGIPAFRAGFVEAIAPAVAGLDILLHPSRAEGLGTAVLDAMSVGVPPVAFAVGGLSEVITDRESGFLVPPEDTIAFAASTALLVLDRDLRGRLGAAAGERAKSFGAAQMTKGVEAVYYRVLRG
ncbi:MAG: glycosyltransferase family 4 protein [Gemmatimonadaceae bacterium]